MDAVTLQVMVGALRAACDEMGVVLVRSAHSANIKERRDSSTGLFDARGEMVMQAEHIPVHLGAMPFAVAAVLEEEQRPGDAWILNDPYRGGTHLPDITLVSPVFWKEELLGFAASRAHHADVGGKLPGSMPADSRTPAEAAREPGRPRRGAAGRPDGPDAHPRPAPGRAARPARGRPEGRRAALRAGGPLRARHVARGEGRDAGLRRAAHPGPHRGAAGR